MTFYSITFLSFFSCLILMLRFVKSTNQQNTVLMIANCVFYAYWDIRMFGLVLLEVIMVYCFGVVIAHRRKKKYLAIPVIGLIVFLGYFKYFKFFIESFSNIFGISETLSLQIILPLGISFYTFQAISYIFDVYYEKIPAEKNFLKLAVYISFFPQIISGPIVKAKDFLPQLNHVHKINRGQVLDGVQIFLMGLVKKIVIADRIGVSVDAVYAAPSAYNGVSVLFAIVGYAIQIYCDFSGYSDMAIGIAKIMGFDLGKNFNIPYLAKNPSDFWRRWHISLSTWFRDYLYIPLGGNRKGKIRTYFNLFVTMVASGIWHGANWTYFVWGCFHGLGSIIYKLFSEIVKVRNWHIENKNIREFVRCLSIFMNNVFVSILWVVFRSDNLRHAGEILSSVLNRKGIHYLSPFVIVFLIVIAFIHIHVDKAYDGHGKYVILDLEKFVSKIILWVVILLMFALMYVGDSAFIYAQF